MMNQTAEYAVRAATFLATKQEPDCVGVRDIAAATKIPTNYLSKILQQLAKRGILHSTRGSGGGFRFRQSPSQISLLQIVDCFDDMNKRRQCILGRNCCDNCPCPLQWKTLCGGMIDVLAKTSLQQAAGAHCVVGGACPKAVNAMAAAME